MLIIDEGFGNLDENNTFKCFQLLTTLKSQFRLILIVSHIPQLKEVAEKMIEIATTGIESKVVVEE